ncbi:MAG: 4Fe-4S binding protein [Bacteroidia bacterium]|nr:4Fe-4S binding protein [Bacteroidia bacterium]
MERDIIKIDDDKCTGCGLCVPNCHEGALQIIDSKVRLVSDLMCDGLGACIGHCPEGAITIERREAEPYDEAKVMGIMVSKGFNTVVAHLRHLREHNETVFLKQGMAYLIANESKLDFMVDEVKKAVHQPDNTSAGAGCNGGCPGSKTVIFNPAEIKMADHQPNGSLQSQLRQWPVQLHLINPGASHFAGSDLLVAADCSAFSLGDFHQNWLKNKTLVIACPKLDQGKEIYLQKFIALIESAKVNTITVLIMEVPCCGGLLQLVEMAISRAARKVPVKAITVSIRGEILSQEWI